MSLITRMLRQRAVWWAQTAPDNFGRMEYSAPVEIRCRWEDGQKEFMGRDSTKQLSRAVVYVDRDIKPGDMLKLGTLVSNTSADPTTEVLALEVKAFDKLPKLRGTENLRTAFL